MDKIKKYIDSKNIIIFLLSIIPIVFLTSTVIRFSVDLPFQDDWWNYVPLIDKVYSSQATFYDFWRPVAEHRVFIETIIAVLLIHFGKWQCIHFTALSLFFMFITYGINVYWILTCIRKNIINKFLYWSIPIISLFLFSLNFGYNWIFNIMMGSFLVLSCIVAGIFILSKENLDKKGFFIAVLLGVIASYSSGEAFCYWPAGFLLLLYLRISGRHKSNLFLVTWCVFSILTIGLHLIDYQKPADHPSTLYIFEDFQGFLHHFFTMVGHPVSFFNSAITSKLGILGLIGFFSLGTYFFKHDKDKIKFLLPFITLGIYSLFVIMIISLSRSGFGIDFAFRDRYVLMTIFFWISNIVFSLVYLSEKQSQHKKLFRPANILIIFFTVFMLFVKNLIGFYKIGGHSNRLTNAQKGILAENVDPDEYLKDTRSFPSMHRYLPTLKKYNLSLYRKSKD